MTALAYTLVIDNEPADADILAAVQSIEVEEHARMAAILRIRFSIGLDETGSAWSLVDGEQFTRLTNIRLYVTLGAGLPEALIEAYVVEAEVNYSGVPGESVLTVVAMDPTVLMSLEEKVRAWPNMADSDIASVLFGEYNFLPDVDATQPIRQEAEEITMQRGSDIQFLRRLAARNGFECYVEPDRLTGITKGYFHPPRLDDDPQGVLSVNMGDTTNVNRFTIHDSMLRPTAAKVAGIEATTLAERSVEVDGASLTSLGSESVVPEDQPRVALLGSTGLAAAGELEALAQSVVDRSAWAVRAEGELSPVTYGNILRAKRTVLVRGAGEVHSGTYYVERVLHTITPDSYTQGFTLVRNGRGLTGRENFLVDLALPS